jgi:hypothetical protein
LESDYGYDLLLFTYDDYGYLEPGLAFFQLKATEALAESGSDYVFDLDLRDYNLWARENYPVFLVLFDATRRQAYWIHVQTYFRRGPSRQPRKDAKTVRVRVPKQSVVGPEAITQMRRAKQALFAALSEGGKQ